MKTALCTRFARTLLQVGQADLLGGSFGKDSARTKTAKGKSDYEFASLISFLCSLRSIYEQRPSCDLLTRIFKFFEKRFFRKSGRNLSLCRS